MKTIMSLHAAFSVRFGKTEPVGALRLDCARRVYPREHDDRLPPRPRDRFPPRARDRRPPRARRHGRHLSRFPPDFPPDNRGTKVIIF